MKRLLILVCGIAFLSLQADARMTALQVGAQKGASGGGGPVTIAGRTTTPSGTGSYNGNMNYAEGFTAANSGTVAKGYLYIKNGFDRNVKMFVTHNSVCYVSQARSVAGITNQWVDFTFSSGPSVTAGDGVYVGFISDYGVDIGQDAGSGWVAYKADSYTSPTCALSSPSYFWNYDTGWYVTN